MMRSPYLLGLVVVLCGFFARGVAAAEYWLCVDWTIKSLSQDERSSANIIWVWGFVESVEGFADDCEGEVTSPGPLLSVPAEDETLTIHLDNRLPALKGSPVPVSLVIAGLPSNPANRALPGKPATYIWKDLKPGTYVYHSGVHPDVQVPMGLYGGIKKDSRPGYAYEDYAYDQEVVLFYSEVDPTLTWLVLFGVYDPLTGGLGSYQYRPSAVLLNGEFPGKQPSRLPAGVVGDTVLLRFLNAATTERLPGILWGVMDEIAEDAQPHVEPKPSFSVVLAAMSTKEALFRAGDEGLFGIFDTLFDPIEEATTENMVRAYLAVNSEAGGAETLDGRDDPIMEDASEEAIPLKEAVDDVYRVAQGGRLEVASPGVTENDTDYVDEAVSVKLIGGPRHGRLSLDGSGGFVYRPDKGFVGRDVFSYKVSDVEGQAAVARVAMQVFCNPCESDEATKISLKLSWAPVSGEVLGYITYSGSTPRGKMRRLSDVSASTGIDLESPSATYTMQELGAKRGEKVCFKVRAYNSQGKSGFSKSVCMTL